MIKHAYCYAYCLTQYVFMQVDTCTVYLWCGLINWDFLCLYSWLELLFWTDQALVLSVNSYFKRRQLCLSLKGLSLLGHACSVGRVGMSPGAGLVAGLEICSKYAHLLTHSLDDFVNNATSSCSNLPLLVAGCKSLVYEPLNKSVQWDLHNVT